MALTLSISIIVITCIISITSFNNEQRVADLSMWPYLVKEKKQYYRFITSGLVHANFMHLAFNMFTLFFFGGFIERQFEVIFQSKLYYLLFYILGLILSDIPTFLKHRNNPDYQTIGASGAVSAVVFAAILFNPWATIYVFVIPMPAILYGVVYLGYTIYMSRQESNGINHDAHLWGAVFGILFPLIFEPRIGQLFLYQLTHHF
ncbi:rhomboid family intramembrane serine protease [Chitinophaga pinensis]|uniref:Rhomboid family protein n=1 Tax=Chitinophaga pinensis (strain ATCC 43595 / DSM 2588 / LMG 13176 / NBRC 15968 / NCIMB 11800 / UQM 2034) TaxID=485918 RepID=A0A979G5L0_CHIPD|nr:rhomboid family intramembrane serine protease [Chitinophaga pinensis]ACU61231.1 Rhomboid family protein [Chitinophaga pinensis DSM 2588]